MAYSTDLELRIDRLVQKPGLSKKNMFGGICYLLNGNMCFGIHKESLVIRTTVENAEKLMNEDDFSPFDITGRAMKGWVMVKGDFLNDNRLDEMLGYGLKFAKTLPKK